MNLFDAYSGSEGQFSVRPDNYGGKCLVYVSPNVRNTSYVFKVSHWLSQRDPAGCDWSVDDY